MNILVVGCGRAGSYLAPVLEDAGHEVSVLAETQAETEMLDDGFTGIVTVGVPIDIDVLRSVGIDGCDVVIAVTHDDNTNIMVAQMAKEIFHTPRVLARIYDPGREEVFTEQFDINTICPTNLTIDAMLHSIKAHGERQMITFGSTTFAFFKVKVEEKDCGRTTTSLKPLPGCTLFGIIRGAQQVELVEPGKPSPLNPGDCLVYYEIAD